MADHKDMGGEDLVIRGLTGFPNIAPPAVGSIDNTPTGTAGITPIGSVPPPPAASDPPASE